MREHQVEITIFLQEKDAPTTKAYDADGSEDVM